MSRLPLSEAMVLRALALFALTAWVWFAGRDLSWDVVNHHLYLPYSLLSGRFRVDLFGAGPQAYQNPLGYLPFFGLSMSGAPAWLVGALLTLLHALCILPLYRLSEVLWGRDAATRPWRVLALALSLSTPAFLQLLGTSSIDPISAVLVLAALAAVAGPRTTMRGVAAAGLCIGLAVAIKPVNAAMSIGLGAFVAARCLAGQLRWRDFAALIGTAVGVALLTAGPWAAWLWATFGNPVFPLFNDLFQSPYAPTQPIVATRFLPTSWSDYLLRPWQMISLRSFSSTEALSPDLRPLMLTVLGVPAIAWAAWRHRQSALRWLATPEVQLTVFALVAYLAWMRSSGNARYALPLLMVAGLLIVSAARALFAPTMARVILMVTVVLHVGYFVADGNRRLEDSTHWTNGPYVEVDVPPRLVQEPHLHLSVGMMSMAALAPTLHPDGVLVNLIGQMSMPTQGPLGEALRSRLQRWQGKTRILITGQEDEQGRIAVSQKVRDRGDALLYRYGLRFDFDDCLPIRFVRHTRDGGPDFPAVSCAALSRVRDDPDHERHEQRANWIFAMLEAQCPQVFAPVPMVSDYDGEKWKRHYVNTDARLVVSHKDGVFIDHFRLLPIGHLGTIENVAAGHGRNACSVWHGEMLQ